jgi:hypothetical protein
MWKDKPGWHIREHLRSTAAAAGGGADHSSANSLTTRPATCGSEYNSLAVDALRIVTTLRAGPSRHYSIFFVCFLFSLSITSASCSVRTEDFPRVQTGRGRKMTSDLCVVLVLVARAAKAVSQHAFLAWC